MKFKIIKLFFLILVGTIVGWREWTSLQTKAEIAAPNLPSLQEVGSATEASAVLSIFLLGLILAFMINGLRYASPKLSSPNSV